MKNRFSQFHSVCMVSMHLEDVVLSMPAIVGARGIETTIPISLDEKEVSRLHESAEMRGRQGKKFGDELPLFAGTGDFAP